MLRSSLSLLLLLPLSCSSASTGGAHSTGDAGTRGDGGRHGDATTSHDDGGHRSRDSGPHHSHDAAVEDATSDVQAFPEIADASVGVAVAYSPFPQALALDSAHLYWTDGQDNTVLAVAKGGGAPITLASGLENPGRLAVDVTGIYLVDALNTAIESVPLDGRTPTTLASFPDCSISGLAIDTTTVYWSDLDPERHPQRPQGGWDPCDAVPGDGQLGPRNLVHGHR